MKRDFEGTCAVGDLQCRCGNLLESGGRAKDGYLMVPEELVSRVEGSKSEADARDFLSRVIRSDTLYKCGNCGCLTLESASSVNGELLVFQPVDPVPNLRVDLNSVDSLGRPFISGTATEEDIRSQKLILKPGLEVRGLWPEGSAVGSIESAVDSAGDIQRGEWVIQFEEDRGL